MKSLLVFSFYLTTLTFVSGIILNETSVLFRPRAINTHHQNPSQKVFLLRSRARERKFGKIMYLKHLMELKCLKKTIEDLHRDIQRKNRLDHQHCHKSPKVSLSQNLQNQILKVKKTRPNSSHVEPQNKTNPMDSRIILLPYKGKFLEEQINRTLKNKIFPSTPSTRIKVNQPTPFAFERRKNSENPKVFTKIENNSKVVLSGNLKKNRHQAKQPNENVKSKPTADMVASGSLHDIKRIQPYEVKELFRKELFNQKNTGEIQKHPLGENNYFRSSFLRRKQGRKAEKLKGPATGIYIKDDKSKSLATLVKPVNSSILLTQEIFSNSPSRSSYIVSGLNKYVNHSGNNFSDLEKKTVNSSEQRKQLIISVPHSVTNSTNSTESSRKTTTKPEIETNFTTTIKVVNVENVFTTVSNAPTNVVTTKYLTEKETKNLEPSTKEPEFWTVASPEFIDKKDLEEPNALFKNQEPIIWTALPLTPNEKELKKFVTKETLTVNESSSNFLFTSSTSQTTAMGLVSAKFSISASPKKTTEGPEIRETVKKIATETNSPEEGLTKQIFTEFTSRPITTDLLTTNKKDQESVGKNSRKMHFNPEILTTTASDQVSQPENLEQRRSDILIDDTDDYSPQGSDFSLNYMKELKQSGNINSSSDSIIQLIPYVINDLRENKISSEDIPFLIKAFGDYWPTVLTLANSTNLDMLPLLKMKNEEDLNKIMSTFFPEKSKMHLVTAESQKASRDKVQAYYYEDDYPDLSKEQQDYWKNEETFNVKRNAEPMSYFEKVKAEQREY